MLAGFVVISVARVECLERGRRTSRVSAANHGDSACMEAKGQQAIKARKDARPFSSEAAVERGAPKDAAVAICIRCTGPGALLAELDSHLHVMQAEMHTCLVAKQADSLLGVQSKAERPIIV